jgi:transcriptional regulator with XRE-family HTH domain
MFMTSLKYTHEITTFQLKAARYALGFKLQDISRLTGIAESTVLRLEAKDLYSYPTPTKLSTVSKLKKLYEFYGIVFLPACGLRLQPISNVLHGEIPDIIDFQEDTQSS